MKLSIQKDLLINAINMVVKIADKHNQRVAILENIKLVLEPNILTLTASDLEVELTATVRLPDNACIKAGSTTLPAEKFFGICRALAGDIATIDAEDGRCIIGSDKGKYNLKSRPAQDFPSIGVPNNTVPLSIDRTDLFEMLGHTRFAMATQDVRHYLTGMLLEINEDKLTAVATDGHRLAVAHRALSKSYDSWAVIVPGKAIVELERLLADLIKESKEGDVVLGIDNDFLQVSLNFSDEGELGGISTTLTARLIEGRFPDYRRVIAVNANRSAVFNKEELVNVMRRLSVLNSKDSPGILFDFKELDRVKVSVRNSYQEEAEEFLPVNYQGEPLEVSFNEAYLRAVLRTLEGQVYLGMTGDVNPVLIHQVNDEMNHLYVVMPMRV
ncbi:DNA polymerase III subunit beta [Moraxella nasovis]|uniref:DNA polymerase III subunit beta n=1 Tax=Moraxella nasovis TaxID=2904121 RepID=UPI001F603B1F|nr:DNA polymerase III subunit beta [Moraxella nasovis]UNU74256.1 DNA polymerase III subunit beta [Moraxella nasovis]